MTYKLRKCSWDITSRCNLRCTHCCAATDEVLDDLDTQDALKLVRQLSDCSPEWVTFTGGEPLMRHDWNLLARELNCSGINVAIISNGTLIDGECIEKMLASGVKNVGVSIDGLEQTHDGIRKKGCYARCREAFDLMKQANIPYSVITTVMRENLDELPQLKNELVNMGVAAWQLQIALPYGRMNECRDSIIGPNDIDTIIDFCYEAVLDRDISIYPADCIGYYTKKETIVRQASMGTNSIPAWNGCSAGISSVHIRNDGSVVGISMCTPGNAAGNIKTRHLKEIWESDRSFRELRQFRPEQLKGYCGQCTYASRCQGGCTAVRYSMGGKDIYAENRHCAYRNSIFKDHPPHV